MNDKNKPSTPPIRMAVVVSHPIQYYAPFYRALNQDHGIEVKAFFASRIGLDKIYDPGMGVEIEWASDLLGGYEHEFLPGSENNKKTSFFGINNAGVGKALSNFRPDVVLLHGYTQMTMVRAIAWCKRTNVPMMMISDSSLHSETKAMTAKLKSILLPIIFAQFSAFLSIGDRNAYYLKHFGVSPDKIFKTPLMVDDGFWDRQNTLKKTRKKIRSQLGLTKNDLAVLFVGKLIARKRPGDLIAAVKKVQEGVSTKKRVRLFFVGDGEQRAMLEEMAVRDKLPVNFLGFVNIDELPDYYCAADILAHPADREVYGIIVLEAAILGLPLVLSDRVGAVGPTSIARPGENALIHTCGDIDELAGLLVRCADEPKLIEELSRQSFEIANEHRGPLTVSRTIEAMEYCLGRTSSNREAKV